MPDFKPSQVRLDIPPLVGTMGIAQCEHAACMLVRACQVSQDTWAAHTPRSLFSAIEADVKAGGEPLRSLMRNPFFTPDFDVLVADGFAVFTDSDTRFSPIEFTDKGFEALIPYVMRPDDDWASCPKCDAPPRWCECFEGAST